MRIVVVEDEAAIREGICRQIEKMSPSYQVVGMADRGDHGIILIRQKKPDLVVTDVRMPEMDGIEMVRQMREDGDQTRVVILSAYSEFEYAKQAIRLGVEEYLLKPVNILELKAALLRVEEQCHFEQDQRNNTLKSLSNISTGLIIGTLKLDERVQHILKSEYGITEGVPLALLQIYAGAAFDEMHVALLREAQTCLKRQTSLKSCVLELPRDKSLLLLMYGHANAEQLRRHIAAQITLNQRQQPELCQLTFGWATAEGFGGLKASVQQLLSLLDWRIVLQHTPLIECPAVADTHTAPCSYPIEQELRMKMALCSDDRQKLSDAFNAFSAYFHGENVYSPKEVKESYIRFIWAGVSIAKDVNSIHRQDIDMQRLLEEITNAKTAPELDRVMEQVMSLVLEIGAKDSGNRMTLTVKRVCSMIHEFYNIGITLDEIADKLNLTPEYVGTQFKKEMGISFSNYIKQYRLSKAKELLLSTPLKLYEIAAAVGYSDPKYFSRQFKESVGQLPGDYKKTH